MFLRWFEAGKAGEAPEMPAPGYKWNETPRLNREIQSRHARLSTKRVLAEFHESYAEIFSLARSLSEEEIFRPGSFAWTGKNPLVSYLGANTASHYRTASKILKRWLKSQSSKT